jgi:hypothetical protein
MIEYELDFRVLLWKSSRPRGITQERLQSGSNSGRLNNMTDLPNIKAAQAARGGEGLMISEANQDVGERAGPRLDREAVTQAAPNAVRVVATQALEAHAERRQRLAAQARVENPARTEEEVEARLEQFGV